MQMIIDLLGYPKQEEFSLFTEIKDFDLLKQQSGGEVDSEKNFAEKFAGQSEQALDLLKKMLVFDPTKRISVE